MKNASFFPISSTLRLANPFSSFNVDYIEPEPLLFQTGYLTIKKVRRRGPRIIYLLSYPNLEVELEGEGRALEALRARGYHERYRGRFWEIYLVGVEFIRADRNIVNFEWERIA